VCALFPAAAVFALDQTFFELNAIHTALSQLTALFTLAAACFASIWVLP
jgi:hypothetical protein